MNRDNGAKVVALRAVSFLAVFLLFVCATGCTDEKSSQRALESQGFTDIRFTGYELFDCSEDDFFRTGFVAKNTKGKQVSGTVCCGMLVKNCTVRW